MRHQIHGKKLNRSTGHRLALYRNLAQSLIEHERITTTMVKAKAVKPVVEKLITRAKGQDLAARRAVGAFLPTEDAADKLYNILAPRFANRPGGYTRVIKIGRRVGDGVEMAVLELVELSAPGEVTKPKAKATKAQSASTKKPATKAKAKTAKADQPTEEATA